MSDNKKYYYLKLKESFFDSDEIILLENMQDGYIYSNILLKLYLRSLKNNGKLMLNDRVPFNSSMLASVTRHSIGDIEKAVNVFKELGLIEILDNGSIYLSDIQNFIGKSSTEADRKRIQRAEIESEKTLIGQMSDKNPPEIELEIELEIERELKLETKKKDFKKPSIEEVKKCISENNYEVDAYTFYSYYENTNWYTAKNKPVKNWKLTLRQWHLRQGNTVKDNKVSNQIVGLA